MVHYGILRFHPLWHMKYVRTWVHYIMYIYIYIYIYVRVCMYVFICVYIM